MKITFKSLAAILFCLATLLAVDEVTAQNLFPTLEVRFSQVGPVGGGFPNVVTWDPNVPGKIYYGSDVGGTGRSTDYGKVFEAASRGLGYDPSHEKIAALNAVDINGDTVIVGGTGFRTGGGEVISSVDGGTTWKEDSSRISFSAQNSGDLLPAGRPRSTDPSLIQWIADSTWVAGTYDAGIWISNDDRKTWDKLDNLDGNVFVRAMVKSPNDPNAFFVGLWGDNPDIENKGLWQITLDKVNGGYRLGRIEKVAGIPDVVESIVALGSRLYIACGRFGVRRYVPRNGNLTDITGPIGTEVMSTAIHGAKRRWNTDRIVLGTADGQGDIWLSEDSGSTWTNTTRHSATDDARLSDVNVSAVPWSGDEALLVFRTHRNWQLGREKCDVAAIQVSPHDSDAWVVCSTSAIWTTCDAGKSWRPANGFQILTYRDVDISPAGTIAVGNVDHDALVSNDGGDHWTSVGFGDVTVAHAVEFSPDGSQLALANNERDGNDDMAKVGVASTPATPATPNLVELDGSLSPRRTTGIAWVTFPKGTQRLIAAVDEGGIQTFDLPAGSKQWTAPKQRTTELMGEQRNRGLRTSVVTDGTRNTFVYDRESGVWRTTNWGKTWTNILTTKAGEDQGYLAYDKQGDKLYISTPTQVLRIDNATSSSETEVLSFPQDNPGAMALDPFGGLIVFAKPTDEENSDTKLFRTDNPSGDGDWRDIGDDNFKRVAPVVVDIEVSSNRIVMPTRGKGILISDPLGVPRIPELLIEMLDFYDH